MNFFWVKLFFPGFLMYRPSWIFCYLSIRPYFILGPRPNAHARGLSMRLCMAMPRACAWCSHGHVHGIATRAPVDYLPRGYTIGKHAVRVPLFNVTNVRMFSEMKKVWRFTKEKHTRLFHLLRRCECRLLTLLLRFLQSRKVEESYLATTVVEICLLHTFARRSQWKLSNVTCVRKCSTVMMCLTATKQLGARSNLCQVCHVDCLDLNGRWKHEFEVHPDSDQCLAYQAYVDIYVSPWFEKWPIGQFGRQCLHLQKELKCLSFYVYSLMSL